jgi:hypothetical protein
MIRRKQGEVKSANLPQRKKRRLDRWHRGGGARLSQAAGRRSSCHEHHVEHHQGPYPEPCVINPTELQRFLSGNRSRSLDFVPYIFLAARPLPDAARG